MNAELPDWCNSLAGFHPSSGAWWRPILCTGAGTHQITFLGVIFDHAETGQTHWSGGVVLAEADPGIALTRVWPIETTTADELGQIQQLAGKGSMHIRCPYGCTPRIPQEEWFAIVDRVRRVEPDWLDVSLYG